MMNDEQLTALIDKFLRGEDRSVDFVKKLEARLDEAFPDSGFFQELVEELASYRPGGGDFLYDENHIAKRLVEARRRLG